MVASACPRCGATVRAGTQFCQQCGEDVRAAQEAADTVADAAPARGPRQADLMELLRQSTQGDYQIIGELGRGGMATVFLADDLALERKVAIKVMSPAMFSGGDLAERFKREARTVGGLSHPHVIPIYAVRETPQLLFFVMKYVEGRGLDQILKEFGPLPIRMVQAIVSQVGSALQHAHRKQIIHRDVKPANIMLDDDGWAVVTDFGIAKVARQVELTKTGSTVGTPFYMSPEQCGGTTVVPASDQYSLGIVAYEMLTGRVPFRGASIMDIMRGHFVEPPPPIEQLRRDCPASLARVVMRMLAKEPEERHPSLEDVITAMDLAPMSSDDPTRTQMVELARSGSRSRPSMPSGHSPLPRLRTTVSALQNARIPDRGRPIAPPAASRRNWKPVLLALGALLFVAVGWGLSLVIVLPLAQQPAAPAPLTRPATDRASTQAAAAARPPEPVAVIPTPVETTPQLAAAPVTGSRTVKPQPAARKPVAASRPVAEPRSEEFEQQGTPARPQVVAPRKPTPRPAPIPDPVAQVAYIRISTRSPNATLLINGQKRSLGPNQEVIPVPPGTVELRIMADGCEPDDQRFTIVAGTTRTIGRFNAKCSNN